MSAAPYRVLSMHATCLFSWKRNWAGVTPIRTTLFCPYTQIKLFVLRCDTQFHILKVCIDAAATITLLNATQDLQIAEVLLRLLHLVVCASAPLQILHAVPFAIVTHQIL